MHARIRAARVRRLRQILGVLLVTFAAVFVINLWTSGNGILIVLTLAIPLLLLALLPLHRQDPATAATIIIVVMAGSLALIMWQGSGLRSSAMFTYPSLLIFCLMIGSRPLFLASYLFILAYMVILVFATHQGWRVGNEHFTSWLTLLEFMVIISAMTLMIRLLAGDLFELLDRLEMDRLKAASSHREAQHMAMHDKLTGLPNRRMAEPVFNDALQDSSESGRSVALVFLDIDNFKQVNDNFGHQLGDDVLLEMTRRMSARLRKTDTLIRFAGDEFLLVLSQIDHREDIAGLLDTLSEQVNEPMQFGDVVLRLAVSMGVVVAPAEGSDFNALLVAADRAMYVAKAGGRNQYYFHETERERAVD